jgi:hypothetical protein
MAAASPITSLLFRSPTTRELGPRHWLPTGGDDFIGAGRPTNVEEGDQHGTEVGGVGYSLCGKKKIQGSPTTRDDRGSVRNTECESLETARPGEKREGTRNGKKEGNRHN